MKRIPFLVCLISSLINITVLPKLLWWGSRPSGGVQIPQYVSIFLFFNFIFTLFIFLFGPYVLLLEILIKKNLSKLGTLKYLVTSSLAMLILFFVIVDYQMNLPDYARCMSGHCNSTLFEGIQSTVILLSKIISQFHLGVDNLLIWPLVIVSIVAFITAPIILFLKSAKDMSKNTLRLALFIFFFVLVSLYTILIPMLQSPSPQPPGYCPIGGCETRLKK